MTSPYPPRYRSDALLLPLELAADPEVIERLNNLVNHAEDHRPFGAPIATSPPAPFGGAVLAGSVAGQDQTAPSELPAPFAVVPVTGDPMRLRDAVRDAGRAAGAAVPELIVDVQQSSGTEPGLVLYGSAKKWGHGMTWVAKEPEVTPTPPRWRPLAEVPGGRRPVVALLDTLVYDHPWLKGADGDPVVVRTNGPDFRPAVPISRASYPAKVKGLTVPAETPLPTEDPLLGSHYGHGTFIAGIIRMTAPDAQVLPVHVMTDHGAVSELNVIEALKWLVTQVDGGQPVDVVNMSFGRPEDREVVNEDLPALRAVIAELRQRGVRIVASAGNQGCQEPSIPAGLATNAGAPVVSVGAGTGPGEHERAPYSNYGPWVLEWRPGTDVISISGIPGDDGTMGLAKWSGTSFSAPIVAGELAQRIVDSAEQPMRPTAA
jgi:hypothetical protein